MPCCLCCCGNQTCVQGQQGKCCCGGSSGTCCQTGQYCCFGSCASAPCCDPSCANGVAYSASGGSQPAGLVVSSQQTITVPAAYSLPVTVCFTGACDDGLAIDGVRVSNFGVVPAPFCMSNRTFLAGIWNDGGPWACSGVFCFYPGCNPLP